MPTQITGSQAVVLQLSQAFGGLAPGYSGLQAELAALSQAGGAPAYARSKAAAFATLSDADLAASVLSNVGITSAKVSDASYSSLLGALKALFGAYPSDRGVVVLNLTNLLTGLEGNSAWGTAAQSFNSVVAADHTYSSDPANAVPKLSSQLTTPTATASNPAPAPAPAIEPTPAPAAAPAAPLVLTTSATDHVLGTTGNDIIDARPVFDASLGFVATLQAADSIDGGAGYDILQVSQSTINLVTASQPNIANIEEVRVMDAVPAPQLGTDFPLPLGTIFAPAAFGGASTLTLAAPSANAFSVRFAQGVSTLNLNAAITGDISITGTTLTAANTLNIHSTAGSVGRIGASGFDTVNLDISSSPALLTFLQVGGTAGGTHLNISGQGVTFRGAVVADTIDASASTGSIVLSNVYGANAFAGVRVLGGSGNDTLMGTMSFSDTISGGAGDDTIRIRGVNQGDVVTGGAGADRFEFSGDSYATTDSRSLLIQTSSGTSQIVRITDFAAGTDKIALLRSGFDSVALGAPQTIASAATLADVYAGISALPASSGSTLYAATVTVNSGAAAGIYLYANNFYPSVATYDMLINLTGMTGTLSAADFVFA